MFPTKVTLDTKEPKPTPPSAPTPERPQYGFHKGQRAATRLFQLTNPELFMKNNKFVMAFGIVTFTGLVTYFALDNMEHKKQQEEKKRKYEERLRWEGPQ